MQPRQPYSWRSAIQSIADAWRNWRERRFDLVQFDQADAREMSEVAKELGLSTAELRTLVRRGKNSTELLEKRLHTLGITPTRVEPAVMRDLQRCCSQCHDKVLCAHELEDTPKEASWPSYCPNEQTIRAMETDKSGARVDAALNMIGGHKTKSELDAEAAIRAEALLKKAQSQFYSLE